jgi:hypothetical protein
MKQECWRLRARGTGWRPMPGARITNLVVPGRPGRIPVADAVDEDTTLAWSISVYDRTPAGAEGGLAQLDANLDALNALFGQRHRLVDVRLSITGRPVRQADAEVISGWTPDVNPGALFATLPVVLSVPSVYWRDVDSAVWSQASPVSGTAYPVDPLDGTTGPITDAEIRITGPAGAPQIRDVVTGGWVTYTGTVAAGRQLLIRCGPMTATEGAGVPWGDTTGNATGALTSSNANRLLQLNPGLTVAGDAHTRRVQVAITATGMTAATQLEVNARRAFR